MSTRKIKQLEDQIDGILQQINDINEQRIFAGKRTSSSIFLSVFKGDLHVSTFGRDSDLAKAFFHHGMKEKSFFQLMKEVVKRIELENEIEEKFKEDICPIPKIFESFGEIFDPIKNGEKLTEINDDLMTKMREATEKIKLDL